ncbi:uncharacterized protein I206_106431 [Kwoniella pini CBS 10737]
MELRPYLPPDGTMNDVHTGIGYGHGLPPSIGTVRPEDIMKAPTVSTNSNSHSGSSKAMESINDNSSNPSGPNLSSAYNPSIQSFPSPSVNNPQTVNGLTGSPALNQPSSSSGNSSNPPIPTSFPHLKQPTSSTTIPSPAWSSPLPPTRSLHLSSTEASSNRPLFSSTEGSGIPPPITPDTRPPVRTTYGKTSKITPSPEKLPTRVELSSSPTSEPHHLSARLRSKSPIKKRQNTILSDEEEEEEPIEVRSSAPIVNGPISKSRVEIVLPKSRPPSASRTKSEEEQTKKYRHHSPDPLDSLEGSGDTPAKNYQPSSSAITSSTIEGGSSRRASSRVADNKAKEVAEKEERRRKRREEKERQKASEEARPNASIKEKSPVKLDSPSKAKSPIKGKGTLDEPIDIDDSLMPQNLPSAEAIPALPPAPAPAPKGRKRKSDVALLGDDDADQDFDPKSTAKAKAKKAKKEKPPVGKKGKNAQKAVKPPVPELDLESKSVIEDFGEPNEEENEKMEEDEVEQVKETVVEEEIMAEVTVPIKSPTPPPPAKPASPIRPPLRATSSITSTPSAPSLSHRPSPGPFARDGTPSASGGIKWKAPRNDLSSVLAKFGGTKRSGLTTKVKIIPLHQKIGPAVKAPPPAPKKPQKKKIDSDEEEEDENGSEDEDGSKRAARDAKKTMEWLMMED